MSENQRGVGYSQGVRVLLAGLAAGLALALAAPASGALELKRVRGTFVSPVQVDAPASVRAGMLYVVEQGGRIIRTYRGRKWVVLDLRASVSGEGEQGLLSAAFHPNWQKNRYLYVYYTNASGASVVARYRMNERGTKARVSSRKRLFRAAQPFANHNGGTLRFGADGKLYLSLGDGGSSCDPGGRAQSLSSPLGKIHQIDGRGSRIVAYGLRNPWRFSFDQANGDMYIGDVGQAAREEVNYLPAAQVAAAPRENYGWDKREGTLVDTCPNEGLKGSGVVVDPIYEYGRADGFTVIGGFVYRGSKMPKRVGRYFFGDLNGSIRSFAARTGTGVRTHPLTLPSLVSFGTDSRRELYLVSRDGGIYRLRDR